jgi:hypothetical protein
MDLFSVDFTLGELALLRQSLDVITITGKDAKFVASLQTKLEMEAQAIQNMLQQAEAEKQLALAKVLEADKKKASKPQ